MADKKLKLDKLRKARVDSLARSGSTSSTRDRTDTNDREAGAASDANGDSGGGGGGGGDTPPMVRTRRKLSVLSLLFSFFFFYFFFFFSHCWPLCCLVCILLGKKNFSSRTFSWEKNLLPVHLVQYTARKLNTANLSFSSASSGCLDDDVAAFKGKH